jgi:hypothetical protein
MAETKTVDKWAILRKPFDKSQVGKLPRGGIQLDYVGHANVTDRFLAADPEWTWEPMAFDERGLPLFSEGTDQFGKPLKQLWIRLTILGVTRPGVGDGKSEKECIGDALRNAGMRFGVALDLWSKEELESQHDTTAPLQKPTIDPPSPEEPSIQIDEDLGKKKEDRVALVKRMHTLLKEHGYTTIEEAEPVYIEVLGKKGATTVGETKEVIKYLEAK